MESDKFKLGLFLVMAFILVCTLFVVFGLFDYGTKKVQMVTLFRESVQGLETGSLVKLRGVPIGKVGDITIGMQDKLIRVDMEINLGKVRMQPLGGAVEKAMDEDEFYRLMLKEIDSGLRAQLELNGISGYKYVELDYGSPDRKDAVEFAKPGFGPGGLFYMPSRPSMLAGLRSSLTEMFAKIAAIDYKTLSDRAEGVLAGAEKLLNDPHLAQTIKNIDDVSEELTTSISTFNKSLTPEKLDRIAADASDSLNNLKHLIEKLEGAIDNARVEETSRSFRDAADTVTETRRGVRETLLKVNEVLDQTSELIKTLDENPEVLIQGKRK